MKVATFAGAAGSALALLLASHPVQAKLVDRGGGLLYDTVLNVTWLQDANAAGGDLSFAQATVFAHQFTYHDSVRNVDLSGWRLPTTRPIDGVSFQAFDASDDFSGTHDWGRNIACPCSELAYMYYVNLGLASDLSTTGATNPGFVPFATGTVVGVDGVAVHDLQSDIYWSGTSPSAGRAWGVDYYNGYQFEGYSFGATGDHMRVWLVRPGDVVAVPEPGTSALAGAGLLALAGLARRRKPGRA